MNKVYVVCEPTKKVEGKDKPAVNLLPATKFGELIVLLPNTQSMLAPVPTVRVLKERLKDFNDEDYIVPVGDPVLIGTVAMVAAEINGGRVKFLKWDKIMGDYFTIQVDTSGKAI